MADRAFLKTWTVAAMCLDCDWELYGRDYKNAGNRIRIHARTFGHAVSVEQVKYGVIDRRPTSEQGPR